MQPYFFPYIGYWQLLNLVDSYVIYDDVNFIKGGWINRNRILFDGKPQYFNVPMLGVSSFKLINEVGVNKDEKLEQKNMQTLYKAYSSAPFFDNAMSVIEPVITFRSTNLAEYVANSIRAVCKYLGITTKLIISSTLEKNNELRGQEKIISICKLLGATDYYNAIGGQEIYSVDVFKNHGINLHFVKTDAIEYKQFNNEFVPNLSIIDIMMFNSKEDIQKMLLRYELI